MRKIWSMFLVTLCLVASLCLAESEEEKVVDTSIDPESRQKLLQVMTDRVVNKLPQFSLTGTLKELSGKEYSINGEVFSINDDTIIQGEMSPGMNAEVRGFIKQGEPRVANQVVVFEAAAPSQVVSEEEEPQFEPARRGGGPHPGLR